jgi:hypothetical protein
MSKISPLEEVFPPEEYNVCVEIRRKHIRKHLQSKSSAHWGMGPVRGTDYFRLVMFSKETRGAKRLVIVCSANLVQKNAEGRWTLR